MKLKEKLKVPLCNEKAPQESVELELMEFDGDTDHLTSTSFESISKENALEWFGDWTIFREDLIKVDGGEPFLRYVIFKDIESQVRESLSNYIDGSVAKNGEYELVEDMNRESLYAECVNKTLEKDHWEIDSDDLIIMEWFIKEFKKEQNGKIN